MFSFYHLPVSRFLLPFILGILFSRYSFSLNLPLFISLSALVLLLLLFTKKLYFHFAFLVLFSFFGGYYVLENSRTIAQHYLPLQQKLCGKIVVEEVLKQTTHKVSFTANVKGPRVLFYLTDSSNFTLPEDTFWLKNIRIKALDSVGTFANYNKYLKQKAIVGVVFLKAKNILRKRQGNSILSNIYKFRCELCKIIVNHKVFAPNELGVFTSLILGERSYLPFELKADYQVSGLIHVLAISGLHIAVLYLFIKFLLQFFRIYHAPSQLLIVFAFLGLYALVAGLSPSVVRAVIMCLLLQFGNVLQEKSNVLNIVLSSALFLLIYRPQWLWDIGFQLSYMAVVFMVILLPLFKAHFKPSKNIVIEKTMELLWVNITASMGTFPILLYHFGVVYLGAIVSGMILVPFSSIAVIFGIGSLAFYKHYAAFHFLLQINNLMLLWMNQAIHSINKFLIPQWKQTANLEYVILFYLATLVLFYPKIKLNTKLICLSPVLVLLLLSRYF